MPTYRVLGQSKPSAGVLTDTYTVGIGTVTVVSSIIAAQQSGGSTLLRGAVAVAGEADSVKQYFAFDTLIAANDVVDFTLGITMGPGDIIRLYSLDGSVSWNIFGEEMAAV